MQTLLFEDEVNEGSVLELAYISSFRLIEYRGSLAGKYAHDERVQPPMPVEWQLRAARSSPRSELTWRPKGIH